MFSAKILFFLITSTFFLQCTSQEKQAHFRGTPEMDYPTYYAIPKTSFRCSDQLYNPGFYADTETRCQVFHYCYEHRQESFLCPMGTIFNQPLLACDYWYSSNCSLAPYYYNVNAIKRNEYLFDEAGDSQDSQSENLFDKMAGLYDINKTPESRVLKNDSVTPENELLSKEGIESSSEPFIEENNKAEYYTKYSYDNQFNMIDEKKQESVKYDVIDFNAVNVHKGSKNEQPYETDNMKDFVFSEDGMLHPSQEDIYQMHPTDMNFDQGYSGYAEIPSEGNFYYDLNEDLDSESDFEIPEFELQKRYSNKNVNYVRRPSSRKPIIVPEVEPEIVQLPVTKHKRKPIGIVSTVSTNADRGSSYETTYDPNIYDEETVSVVNKGFEGTASGEFPLDESNSNLNYKFNDPKLHEIPEEIGGENDSQLYEMDGSNVIYDYSNKKKTRNPYVLSNADEISSNVFVSENNDLLGISNVKHRTLTDSNYGDETEIFTEDAEGSIILPGESSDTTVDNGSSSDSDAFLGSGSEENIQPHSSDGSSFPEDQDIFSDGEDTEITDIETPYVLPMNLSNTFEGSGISVQKTVDMPNFAEEGRDPTQLVLEYDSEGNLEYGREASFSPETFGKFSPSESSENELAELVPDGSGGSIEFNLPHELQEASDNSPDDSDETVPEIREIDGAFYVFSDSENHPNYEYDDASRFYSQNGDYAVIENLEDVSNKASEEFIDSEDSQYVPEGSNLKMDYIGDEILHTLDYQDSRHSENAYKKQSDEFEAETSSDIPDEEYAVDDSDTTGQFTTEDIKFLDIMSQTPIPMLKNLFEVSEKSSFGAIEDEIPRTEFISAEQDIINKNHENPAILEDVYEFENLFSDSTSDAEENSDMEFSDIHSEILDTEQKSAEEASDKDDSDQDGTEFFLPEQNLEVFVSGKEADPFNSLFAEGDEILDGPGSKQKSSLKAPPIKSKNVLENPVMSKDLKKVARGKRSNQNLRTFNPPNKGNSLTPRKETFREAIFTSIPSEFLKMKHSTLKPYFYNYGLKNSGFNSRSGDLFDSSKLSKLTSFGKRLLAAKSAKFNTMKKYIDSYRNN